MAAIGKVLDEVVEVVGGAAKADALAKETARAAEGAKFARRRNLDAEMDALVAKHKQAKTLNTKPQEEIDAIAVKANEEREAQRVVAITDPKAKVSFDYQATNPDEFKQRLVQMRDNKYSINAAAQAKGLNMPNPLDEMKAVEPRWGRWAQDNQTVYKELEGDRSLKFELDEYVNDGAYRADFIDPKGDPNLPAVFWHSDVYTDPRLADKGFIQFDPNAREIGFHAGSKKAATDVLGSPEVLARSQKNVDDMRGMFEELSDMTGQPLDGVYEEAFDVIKHNMFLRMDEAPIDGASELDMLDLVVDDFFEEIRRLAGDLSDGDIMSDMQQIANLPSPELLKSKLRRAIKGAADSTTVPFVTNVKQGLHVPDLGHNTARNMAEELKGRGIFTDEELDVISNATGNADANIAFRSLLESKGYDHLIMHNGAEDLGVPSIVLWKEDSVKPLWESGTTKNDNVARRLRVEALLAPLAAMLGLDKVTSDAKSR